MAYHKGRKPRRYSQVARISVLLRRLIGGASVGELADELQVTKRQVHRDLQQLEDSGYPLEQEQEEGRWRLPAGFKGLEVTVSPYELMSLHLAQSHLAYLRGTPFVDDLESVIRKVEAGLPDKVRNHLERIVTAFASLQRPIRAYAAQKQVIESVRKALLRQRRVVLHGYQKPGGRPQDYLVDPYGLVLYQYGLYLVGHSHRAKALRTFALERIKTITVTEDMFELPQSVPFAERLDRAFGLIEKPSQEVKIWIAPDWVYFVEERQWHPTQTLKLQKDGSVILTMRCGGFDELTAWVLSFGPGAKALSPQALIDNVSSQLTAAAESYRTSC
ncbi:MAG: WYL domain-containing protein [Nitrospira sp.]|nr:WYL domain-containing protein [Nitrospira sp.]MBH0183259.1 WYL domain-containing protein [Nitrospira sp.]MBH0187160.1 WYL domain-containing protein [Nitrospira sp.]